MTDAKAGDIAQGEDGKWREVAADEQGYKVKPGSKKVVNLGIQTRKALKDAGLIEDWFIEDLYDGVDLREVLEKK